MLHGYKICAVFISRIHEEVLREFIEALGAAFRPHGWRVMVFCTGSDLFWHTASDRGQESIFDLPDPAILDALRKGPYSANAAIIGEVVADHPGKVVMTTEIGAQSLLPQPGGELLPRIC